MESVWELSDRRTVGEQLSGDVNTDVLVIGGGLTGILCAHMLMREGVDVVMAEADEIMGGVSGRTTAKITAQHGLIYSQIVRQFGAEKARLYLNSNMEALEEYRRICANVDCDFEERDAYVYARVDSAETERKIREEAGVLKKLGCELKQVHDTTLPFPVACALEFPRQAQFHPIKFALALARELRIFTHTPVRELVGTTAVTDRGKIKAKKIIVATHFPFINKHGLYFMKMYQQRSYVLALEGAKPVGGMYIDGGENGLSFRDCGELLLLGGGGHRTGKPGGSWRELTRFAKKYYPHASVKYRFATQDCMTLDGIPYIGAYSAGTENLYVATGFNKWGMTSSMVAAKLLCDIIRGRSNPYTELYSPSRTVFRSQLGANALEALVGWLTPSSRRCPHLGCALKWNPAEHTWDCPCHGSRFSSSGRLLNNPATGDLK